MSSLSLLAEHAALGVDVLDRHLGAALHLLAEGGVLAGDRPDHGDRNVLRPRPSERRERDEQKRGDQAAVRRDFMVVRSLREAGLGSLSLARAPAERSRALVEPGILRAPCTAPGSAGRQAGAAARSSTAGDDEAARRQQRGVEQREEQEAVARRQQQRIRHELPAPAASCAPALRRSSPPRSRRAERQDAMELGPRRGARAVTRRPRDRPRAPRHWRAARAPVAGKRDAARSA